MHQTIPCGQFTLTVDVEKLEITGPGYQAHGSIDSGADTTNLQALLTRNADEDEINAELARLAPTEEYEPEPKTRRTLFLPRFRGWRAA